jgi:transmembrane sensor
MPYQFEHNDPRRAAKARRIAYLLSRFMRNTITSIEQDELDEWVGASETNMQLFEELTDEVNVQKGLKWMNEHIPYAIKRVEKDLEFRVPRKRKKRQLLISGSVLLFTLASSVVFFETLQHQPSEELAPPSAHAKEIGNKYEDKGVLTLSDGRVIILDQMENGDLAIQGASTIAKENGLIKYSFASANEPKKIEYNTISTPRGGSCVLSLSDGTKVWLNAASSIRYPVVCNEHNKISVTGEVYFEIPAARSPLKIEINNKCGISVGDGAADININAYEDNGEISVTVLKGAASVITRKQSTNLNAKQQASIAASRLEIKSFITLDQVIAWHKGYMQFRNENLQTILKTISRQYDVDVTYENEGGKDISYSALIPVNRGLHGVLNILSGVGARVFFKLEGKKLKVININES